jgi:phosphomannomutase
MRDRLPTYAIVKEKLACPARDIAPALRRMAYEFRPQKADNTDGLKIAWPDRWIQARASNTEPIIRVTAEAPTEGDARAMIGRALEAMKPSR